MRWSSKRQRQDDPGAALLIVLALVVLVTALVVAYFSRATTDRQVAHGSFNQSKADQLADSAAEMIIGDLRTEIANGSNPPVTVGSTTIYTPSNNLYVLPVRSGNPPIGGGGDPVPNLIRRSVRNDGILAPGVSSQASFSNSTDPSKNGRSVTLSRWNKHYLIPRDPAVYGGNSNKVGTDPDPSFTAPDWVIVTRNGIAPFNAWSSALSDATATNNGYAIGRYAYAIYDEGGLLDVNVAGYPQSATPAQYGPKGLLSFADLRQVIGITGSAGNQIDNLVAWRNYASGQASGIYPSLSCSATAYVTFVINSANSFLNTSGQVWNARTDQIFASRQELIALRSSTGFTQTALLSLGTFSRIIDYPTWGGAATIRVTSPFVRRSDGSTAQIGEPLFRRFPITHLAWLGATGIVAPGDASSVKRDFGLIWNSNHWDYWGATGAALAAAIPPITGDKEPDFFQILTFAKPSATISEILSTGASLIDRWDADNITTWIEYANPGGGPNLKAWGMESVTPPNPAGAPTPASGYVAINRPLRNVGEFGYAYKNSTTTLDFYTSSSSDAAVLDLFAYSETLKRAGLVNLNTRNSLPLAALISGTYENGTSTFPFSTSRPVDAANAIVNVTANNPAQSRQDLARITSDPALLASLGTTEEKKEVISRALGDLCQTRTWNLMIDVIAQSGRYPPGTNDLAKFYVEGEQRYWVHVAIDRFTGEVIDRQIEIVKE